MKTKSPVFLSAFRNPNGKTPSIWDIFKTKIPSLEAFRETTPTKSNPKSQNDWNAPQINQIIKTNVKTTPNFTFRFKINFQAGDDLSKRRNLIFLGRPDTLKQGYLSIDLNSNTEKGLRIGYVCPAHARSGFSGIRNFDLPEGKKVVEIKIQVIEGLMTLLVNKQEVTTSTCNICDLGQVDIYAGYSVDGTSTMSKNWLRGLAYTRLPSNKIDTALEETSKLTTLKTLTKDQLRSEVVKPIETDSNVSGKVVTSDPISPRSTYSSSQSLSHSTTQKPTSKILTEPPVTQLPKDCLIGGQREGRYCDPNQPLEILRWSHHANLGCVEFLYKGCGGNTNNYRSKIECLSRCRYQESKHLLDACQLE